MKYGIIKYTTIPKGRENIVGDTGMFNIGDNIQMYAMKRILTDHMHVDEKDIIEVDFHSLADYSGEYVILPVNLFFFGCHDLKETWFPASPYIIPVFVGVHFSSGILSDEEVSYLKLHSPIGCRDKYTLNTMRKYGIPAYLAGCVTATLPRRPSGIKGDKVFCVDVDSESVLKVIPEELKKNIELIGHVRRGVFSPTMYEEADREAEELIKRYYNEAALVVTSRLHCASPCAAMGIPTIMVAKEISSRFSWLGSILPIYTDKEYDRIDWDVKPSEYEDIKEKMIRTIVRRLREAYDKWSDLADISSFFEKPDSKEETVDPYDVFFASVDRALSGGIKGYYLWGGTALAEECFEHIRKKYPQIPLLGLIDEYNPVSINGLKSMHFDETGDCGEDILMICTPSSSKNNIKDRLLSSGSFGGSAVFFDGEIVVKNRK